MEDEVEKKKNHKLRPWEKANLIHDLAKGEMNSIELGEKYGMHDSNVRHFARRPINKEAIRRIREQGMEKLAGLWIADKVARIAEYQQDAEDFSDNKDPAARKVAQAARRAVAEELGQITTRADVNASVSYDFGPGNPLEDVVVERVSENVDGVGVKELE